MVRSGGSENPSISIDQVDVDVGRGEEIPARIFAPATPGSYHGAMIVVSEFGINPGPIHAAELYASKGFVAIVPEIFFRDRQRVLSVEAQSIAAGRK